jgi:hypothetical protein
MHRLPTARLHYEIARARKQPDVRHVSHAAPASLFHA